MKKYTDVITDIRGNAIALATVTVVTYPGSGAAVIYSDEVGTVVPSSILTTDSEGTFSAYIPPGRYNFQVRVAGALLKTITDVQIDEGTDEEVGTIAALRLITGRTDGQIAHLLGYYAAGDGGGGQFYWNAASTATDNGGTVILPTGHSGAGRWLSSEPHIVTAMRFGAFQSRTAAQNTTAIDAAIVYAAAEGLSIELDEPGYLNVNTLTGASSVKFTGRGAFFDKLQATVIQMDDGPADTPVKPTGEFTWLPFNVLGIAADGTVITDFDIESYKPAVTVTYWVDPVNGSDAAAGTSPGAALLTVSAAYGKADYDKIVLFPGEHVHTGNDIAITRSHTLESISGNPEDTIVRFGYTRAWTVDTGTTYKTSSTVSAVVEVFDAKYRSEDGDYKPLDKLASIAAVDAAPGSWFWDSGSSLLYVHCHDARTPDDNIKLMRGVGLEPTGLITMFCQGIGFEGGNNGQIHATNSSSANFVTLYMKDCSGKYVTDSALDIDGCDVYLQNCDFAYCGLDNLSYTALNSKACRVVEIDVRSRYAGWRLFGTAGTQTQNASSNHDSGNTVRLGGRYHDCYGPIIPDTGSSARTWNVAVRAYRSRAETATQNVNFYTEGVMYLDRCSSHGSTYDIRGNLTAGARLDLHEFRSEGTSTFDQAASYARQY